MFARHITIHAEEKIDQSAREEQMVALSTLVGGSLGLMGIARTSLHSLLRFAEPPSSSFCRSSKFGAGERICIQEEEREKEGKKRNQANHDISDNAEAFMSKSATQSVVRIPGSTP